MAGPVRVVGRGVQPVPLVVMSAVAAVLVTACGAGSTAPPPPPGPAVAVNVPERGVLPGTDRLLVDVPDGELRAVTLRGPDGAVTVPPAAGSHWQGPGDLTPHRSYTVQVTAVGAQGSTTRLSRTFTTGEPAEALRVKVFPADRTVGVGQPIIVTLSAPVRGQVLRAGIERALSVQASIPVEGGWAWLNDNTLHYRPKDFWPADDDVTVHLALTDVHASPGVWGTADRTVTFRTGAAQVVHVDSATHQLTVTRDGRVVRTMPVSLGKAGHETRSGVKVVMERHATFHMDSSTVGVELGPEAYNLDVPYALRITNSGEFLHGAPWNHQIGRANTSHGCTNLRVADARWLYDNLLIGDPVITVGTGRAMEPTNGWGGDWDVSWADWQAGSALT